MASDDRLIRAIEHLAGGHFVTWRAAAMTIGGVFLGASLLGASLISAHSAQPHAGAVTRLEYEQTIRSIDTRLQVLTDRRD